MNTFSRGVLALVITTAVLAVVGPISSSDAQVAEVTRVMPVGDSITEARTNSQGIPSYRAALWDQLQVAGADVDFVGSRHGVLNHFDRPSGMSDPGGDWDKDHDGHYGWTADEILNGLHPGDGKLSDWLTDHDPDVLLVHIGTNDLNDGQTVSSTIEDVRQIVATARAHDADIDVVLATLIASNTPTRQAAITMFNLALPGLVAELDAANSRVVLADLASGYQGTWNYDDLHPGPLGQTHMATGFATALLSNGLVNVGTPPPPGACGTTVEAEDATLSGTVVSTSYAGASGGLVAMAPERTGNALSSTTVRGTIEVCLHASESGDYVFDVGSAGPRTSSNSYWFSIDGGTPFIYDTPLAASIVPDELSARGAGDPFTALLTAGDHTVRLWVREDGTPLDRISLRRVGAPPEDQPPTAAFTVTCVELRCDFDGAASSDDNGITTYSWDLAGTVVTGVAPSATFPAAGDYPASLTVTDTNGATHTTTQTVTVSVEEPPPPPPPPPPPAGECGATAEAEAGTVSGTLGVAAMTGASGGQVVRSNEGSGSTTSPTRIRGELFLCVNAATAGDYVLDTRVTGPSGSSDSFFFSIDGGTSYVYDTPRTSTLVDDELKVRGGGDPHIMALTAGDHELRFWVRDDGTALDRVTLRLVGEPPPPPPPPANEAPVARATVTCAELTCDFDGVTSTDDAAVTAWAWTFGDGNTSNAQQPSHTYAAAGTYAVALTVTDAEGLTGSTNLTVEVSDAPPPPPPPPPDGECTAVVEAEDGEVTGTLYTSTFAGASGGSVVLSDERTGNALNATTIRGTLELCVLAAEAGLYEFHVVVSGPTSSSNSFWFSVDGGEAVRYSYPVFSQLTADELAGNGQNPWRTSLTAGEHTLLFWVREDGSVIDRVELVKVG